MGIFSFLKKPDKKESNSKAVKSNSNFSQFGDVGLDKRNIQTSTGKPYPPNLELTQPNEYGIRIRSGEKFQTALGQVLGKSKTIWSGKVDVLLVEVGGKESLEVSLNGVILGDLSSAALAGHPAISQGVRENKQFRGAIFEDLGSLKLRIFMKI